MGLLHAAYDCFVCQYCHGAAPLTGCLPFSPVTGQAWSDRCPGPACEAPHGQPAALFEWHVDVGLSPRRKGGDLPVPGRGERAHASSGCESQCMASMGCSRRCWGLQGDAGCRQNALLARLPPLASGNSKAASGARRCSSRPAAHRVAAHRQHSRAGNVPLNQLPIPFARSRHCTTTAQAAASPQASRPQTQRTQRAPPTPTPTPYPPHPRSIA